MARGARRGQASREVMTPVPGPTIVCGIDSSGNASAALAFAHILAGWLDWRLMVVHVAQVPVIPGVSMVPGGYEELRDNAREEGEELIEAVLESSGLPEDVERRVETGERVQKLVAVCEQEGAGLLVVGAPGRGWLATALLGSVATRLAGQAPCPVAIVPEGASAPAPALGSLRRRPIPVETISAGARASTTI
jgi:nucleotide-binding universal stress UspA family protein